MLIRKLPVVCGLATVLLTSAAGAPPVLAAPKSVQLARDQVVGDGTQVNAAYHFDVSSGPSGENPSGHASITDPLTATFTSTQIECLSVTGNTATFVYRMAPTLGLVRVEVTATDNGPVDDTVGSMFYDPSATPTCTPITGFEGNGGQLPGFITGQIVVIDAAPPPTSRDQCRNGGWRNYPGFKHQGVCVGFVATGGKNPPANSP